MMDFVRILGVVAICSAAVKAEPIVPSEITVMEGDNATFARGLDDTMHASLIDKATKAVLLSFAMGKDMTAEKSIDVYIKDGAIIMPHVQRNYSKHYELQIANDPRTPFSIKLNVTARLDSVAVKAAPIVPSEITVMEGDDATFARGLDDTMHAFLVDKATKAALLSFVMGEDKTAEKSIDVYIKDGAIIMPHVQRNYSKDYELRIYNSDDQLTPFSIKLNVTARLPPVSVVVKAEPIVPSEITVTEGVTARLPPVSDDPSLKTTPPPINEEQRSLYISLGVIGGVVVVGSSVALFVWHRNKKKQKPSSSDANKVKAARNAKGEFSCCIEVTGADSSASSSRSNSSVLEQEKDEEKLVTSKHP